MTREDFSKLDEDTFRVNPGKPLTIRGSLSASRDNQKPATVVHLEPLHLATGDYAVSIDTAIFQKLREVGAGNNGLSDLTPNFARDFANRLQEFIEAAEQVVELCRAGRGLRVTKERRK